MLRKSIWTAGIAALTAALVMFSASPILAAPRGGGGGGGSRGGAVHVGTSRGFNGGGFSSRGFSNGRGFGGVYLGAGYGYPYYYGGYYNYDSPYYGSSYYSDYVYPSAPQIYTPPYTSSYYSPPATIAPASYDASDALKATIAVHVPPNAQVWFDGAPTQQTGDMRQFVTPTLDTGKVFHYDIRAQWMDNGKMVEQTRHVEVRAGNMTPVDFLRPQ